MPHQHKCTCLPEPVLPLSSIGTFIDQVLSGLAFIHKHNMIHMDIKPANILFTLRQTRHTFFISDFGVTRNLRSARGFCGTLCYEAPDTHASTASDVYSLGIVLLEMLGLWCPEEGSPSVWWWQEKLRVLGVNKAVYCKYEDRSSYLQGRVYSRIKSLVDYGIVSSAVGRVLEENPRQRATASEARVELLLVYPPLGACTNVVGRWVEGCIWYVVRVCQFLLLLGCRRPGRLVRVVVSLVIRVVRGYVAVAVLVPACMIAWNLVSYLVLCVWWHECMIYCRERSNCTGLMQC